MSLDMSLHAHVCIFAYTPNYKNGAASGENRGFAYAKTRTQISAFVFASRMVQFLFFLNPTFQASAAQTGLCQTGSEIPKTGFLASRLFITKTCPCSVYPLEPHFHIAKLGFGGVYLFFLFLLQNINCWYSLEPPPRGGSNVYPRSMF